LETKKFRYQAAISDLSNSDICAHHDQPRQLVKCVGNWLENEAGATSASASSIWAAFNDFTAETYAQLRFEAYNPKEIEEFDVIKLKGRMITWLEERDSQKGTVIKGKPGFVFSPFAPSSRAVDVRRFTRGRKVKCPHTNRIFIVP
jgi:hypothetical protein